MNVDCLVCIFVISGFKYILFEFGSRIFVATWNVAGKSPPSHLNLEDWLHTSPPADIYVLGWVFGFLDFDCDTASLVYYLVQLLSI